MIEFIDEKGIIEPSGVVTEAAKAVKAFGATSAVTTFSNHIFNEFIEKFGAKKITAVTGGMDNDVYGATYNGKPIVVYRSPVGAPAAAMSAEEVLACGIENLVAFGICGALTDVPVRTFVVPTEAYRDEGTSRHYARGGEFITLDGAGALSAALKRYGLKTVEGGSWCTDALYRETRTRFEEMRAKGCIAVDMECAALQAVCNYRKKKFYTFFVTADSLAGEAWEPNYILNVKAETPDTIGAEAAIRFASELVANA